MAYGKLNTDIVQSSTAGTPPQFNDGNSVQIGTLCRAWVNFNGTGTVAIRGSFNVSSITDNGTGDYTVNFTTAMPDLNYSASVTAGDITNGSQGSWEYIAAGPTLSRTASAYRLNTGAESVPGFAATSLKDVISVSVAIFR